MKTLATAAAFTLLGAFGAMAQQCPAIGSVGSVVEVDGSSLNRGIRTEVIAGYFMNVWYCESTYMVGYMCARATLTMRLTGSRARGLEVVAESDCDPTLFIELPAGQVVFDDNNGQIGRGLDPVIPLPAVDDGTYNIWVGSHCENYYLPTLRIRYRR